ncbi:MAG: Hpt domain-containing protein [Vallitaleaceae bacterium]|nr:Hpt domain-containing protein [Vallitaleaceae bacterium]
MDITQYLEIFIEESKEHLQGLNTSLLELEKGSLNKDVINEVFRAAHTLKGMAATMGFKGMNVLTHDMENILSEIRNDNMKVDANLLDVLFQCLDALEQFVESIIETGSEGPDNNEALIGRLNAILKGQAPNNATSGASPVVKSSGSTNEKADKGAHIHKYASIVFSDFERNALIRARKENYNCFGVTLYISSSCVLKSARAFIIFRTLENLGQIIKAVPIVQDIEDEKFDNDFSVFIVT